MHLFHATRRRMLAFGPLLLMLGMTEPALATNQTATPTAQPGSESGGSVGDYFAHWFDRVDAARASQPHWMLPVVAPPPFLVQVVRYDQVWQHLGNGADIHVFGQASSIRLIPATTSEVDFLFPTYQEKAAGARETTGFASWPFIAYKQRLLSANEADGNYVLSASLGAQAPTGTTAFPANHEWAVTPTFAGGKGWGDFDIQASLGAFIPFSPGPANGTYIFDNVVFQYHILTYIWPELELNHTYWSDGPRAGKNQLMMTPGVVFGKFEIGERLRGNFGIGYQFAVTPDYQLAKTKAGTLLTPTYNHAWVLTARMAF